jgi:hypothetical protein
LDPSEYQPVTREIEVNLPAVLRQKHSFRAPARPAVNRLVLKDWRLGQKSNWLDPEVARLFASLPGFPHGRISLLDMLSEPVGVEQRTAQAIVLEL